MISSAFTRPSSIALASMSALVGASLPTCEYFTRARLMYMSTVWADTPIPRATDDYDMDWNHHSSA